jgi:hypothetical protein
MLHIIYCERNWCNYLTCNTCIRKSFFKKGNNFWKKVLWKHVLHERWLNQLRPQIFFVVNFSKLHSLFQLPRKRVVLSELLFCWVAYIHNITNSTTIFTLPWNLSGVLSNSHNSQALCFCSSFRRRIYLSFKSNENIRKLNYIQILFSGHYPSSCFYLKHSVPEISTSFIDWAQPNSFHLKAVTESSLRKLHLKKEGSVLHENRKPENAHKHNSGDSVPSSLPSRCNLVRFVRKIKKTCGFRLWSQNTEKITLQVWSSL